MEIRWLDDFIALAKTRHFSRAAEQQNVTQPTLSRRIKLLEDEMGVTLIDRNTLPLSLTPAGEVFLAGAQQIVRIAGDTKVQCREIRQREDQQLTFATSQSLYLRYYHDWVTQLAEASCVVLNHNLKSTAWVPSDFVAALSQQERDLMLCYWHPSIEALAPLNDPRFDYLVVGEELLVPVTALGATGQKMFELDSAIGRPLPFIGYHSSAFLRPVIDRFIQQKMELPQFNTINENLQSVSVKAMIKEGFGVGWLPQGMIQSGVDYGRLALAGGEQWQIPIQIRLYRLLDNPRSSLQSYWQQVADQRATGF